VHKRTIHTDESRFWYGIGAPVAEGGVQELAAALPMPAVVEAQEGVPVAPSVLDTEKRKLWSKGFRNGKIAHNTKFLGTIATHHLQHGRLHAVHVAAETCRLKLSNYQKLQQF